MVNVNLKATEKQILIDVDGSADARVLFDQAIQKLNIREPWFFGLEYTHEKTGDKKWMDLNNKILVHPLKKSPPIEIAFKVRFYGAFKKVFFCLNSVFFEKKKTITKNYQIPTTRKHSVFERTVSGRHDRKHSHRRHARILLLPSQRGCSTLQTPSECRIRYNFSGLRVPSKIR